MRSYLEDEMVHQTTVQSLDDESDYVKKIALFGLLKLNQANSAFIEELGIIDKLYAMLKSNDTTVLSSVIHVLNELMRESGGMAVNNKILIYLLNR